MKFEPLIIQRCFCSIVVIVFGHIWIMLYTRSTTNTCKLTSDLKIERRYSWKLERTIWYWSKYNLGSKTKAPEFITVSLWRQRFDNQNNNCTCMLELWSQALPIAYLMMHSSCSVKSMRSVCHADDLNSSRSISEESFTITRKFLRLLERSRQPFSTKDFYWTRQQ